MYKFIFDRVYPSAPKPATSTETVKTAIIESLVGHLYRLGCSVDEVRVPGSLVPGEPPLFLSSYGQIRVAAGLDAYGDNVVTSALTGTNDATASATVAADTIDTKYVEKSPATVRAMSDDDLVRLIGGTIRAQITNQTGHRDNWDVVDRDEDGQVTWVLPTSGVEPQIVARAVLAKLRTHGVIR